MWVTFNLFRNNKTYPHSHSCNKATHTDNSISTNGINPIKIGFKTRLFEEKGIIPLTSFIAHLVIPASGTKEFQTNYFAPSFRFTMQHTLTDKISLGYNLGAEWDGETPEPTFIYTLKTGFSLTEKIGAYVELYGFAPQKDKADCRRWYNLFLKA